MSYPSPELLPRGAPFIPFLFVQEKTVLLVVFEEIVQFAGSMAVHDYSIGFIVPAQTACITGAVIRRIKSIASSS